MTPPHHPDPDDVVVLVTREHEGLRDLLSALRADPDRRQVLRLRQHLAAHLAAERRIIGPLTGGTARADAMESADAARELLDELTAADPRSVESVVLIGRLEQSLARHTLAEERRHLPVLIARTTPRQRRELGRAYRAMSRAALRADSGFEPPTSG